MAVAKSLSLIKYLVSAAALYRLPILFCFVFLLPIVTFGVLACTFTLYCDNAIFLETAV